MCVRGLGEGGAGLGWLTAVAFWDSLWHGAIINVVVTYTWSFPARTSQNLRRERRLFQTSVDPLTAAHIPPLMQSWVLILPFVPALHGDLHACCVFEEITSFQVQIPQHCCKRRPHHYTIFFLSPICGLLTQRVVKMSHPLPPHRLTRFYTDIDSAAVL